VIFRTEPMPSDLATNGCDLLFVYGTLRRGASHHHILQSLHARFLGPAMVAGELFDLGRFPGARAIEPTSAGIGGRRVTGELYRLRRLEPDLAALDRYEGLQPSAFETSLFCRRVTRVWKQNVGGAAQAWIYCLSRRPAAACLIPSGDYSKAARRLRGSSGASKRRARF